MTCTPTLGKVQIGGTMGARLDHRNGTLSRRCIIQIPSNTMAPPAGHDFGEQHERGGVIVGVSGVVLVSIASHLQ